MRVRGSLRASRPHIWSQLLQHSVSVMPCWLCEIGPGSVLMARKWLPLHLQVWLLGES
jgi:hypothetical protein